MPPHTTTTRERWHLVTPVIRSFTLTTTRAGSGGPPLAKRKSQPDRHTESMEKGRRPAEAAASPHSIRMRTTGEISSKRIKPHQLLRRPAPLAGFFALQPPEIMSHPLESR